MPHIPHTLAASTALALVVTIAPGLAATSRAAAPAEGPEKATAFVVWDTPAVNPGTRVRAHGKVPGSRRKVAMQVKVQRTWRTIGTTRSNGEGRFRIRGRLDWYGLHKVRVVAPGRRPYRASKRIGVYSPYIPLGSRRDFTLFHGTSVRQNYRFNPCQVVQYRINSADVGPAAADMVRLALLQASWATGIRFKYTGSTNVVPYNRRKPFKGGTDLVIAWASNSEVPDFVKHNKAGYGGPRWIYTARDSRGRRTYATDDAGVTLSTEYWADFAPSFADNTRAAGGQLLLHEIGHALGLGHVRATEQLMNGRSYYRSPDGYWKGLYNAGDLTGLSKVGLKQGCLRKAGRGRYAAIPAQPLA